jgi:ATP-dependent DNA helicase RecG
MESAFEKLRKILAQEHHLGYSNKAVIGGLDKFADHWYDEVRARLRPEQGAEEGSSYPQMVDEVVQLLREYPRAGEVERRRQIVAEVESKIAALDQPASEAQAAPPAAPTGTGAGEEKPPPAREEVTAERVDRAIGGLDSPITRLPGINVGYAKKLQRLNVETIGDLLTLFPRRYDDYRALKTINQLQYGETVTIIGHVKETHSREMRKGGTLVQSLISDSTATIQATWFNQPYLVQQLKPGRQIVLSGKVGEYLGRLVFSAPEWEPLDRELIHTGRLAPVYPLTEGIGQRRLRRLVKKTVDYWADRLPDHLPAEMRERAELASLGRAFRQIHFPDSSEELEQARRRLTFDEFLLIQLGVLRQRRRWRRRPGIPIAVDDEVGQSFVHSLPFTLTSAQQRVLREIVADLRRAEPMNRLLQGDVGSGKTVVAVAALVATVSAGHQAAIMAPTEILTEQHYKNVTDLLSAQEEPPTVRLLTGSLSAAEKEEIHGEIASGQAQIAIGTHALIQEGVSFKELGLVVIDEQHRFGVAQRASLRSKGRNPHLLVMSATPIPRTLALTIYGDLDISVLDEMPPGRPATKTRWLTALERERGYAFIRSQVQEGRQAFIICPLVEESEKVEAKAAVEEYERLQGQVFPDLRLGLLHGRMKAEEKEAVMTAFRQQEIEILVSTSVVEVGIDVPNATIMLVEGADRFGLAQLHQFRGRVGRGAHESYCLLLTSSGDISEEAARRLAVLEETRDGFKLAEEDLKLRGPGEFFGTRQSGLPDLKLAKLGDVRLLELARSEAQRLFREDPELASPEHRLLAHKLDAFWRQEGDLS